MKYCPILNYGDSEINALSNTYKDIQKFKPQDQLLPILELPRKTKKESFDKKMKTQGSYLQKKIGANKVVIDSSDSYQNFVFEDIVKYVNDTYAILTDGSVNFIPMVHYDDKEELINALSILEPSEVWIRFTPHLFQSAVDKIIINGTIPELSKLFKNSKISYVADFYQDVADINRITDFLALLHPEHNNVILSLTSCPQNADMAVPESFTNVGPRTDLAIFKKELEIFPDLVFSDYTVRLKPEPTTEEKRQINLSNTYFKIFYSTDTSYFIGKSSMIKLINDGSAKVSSNDLCSLIVSSPNYDGSDYSSADKEIMEISKGKKEIKDHKTPIRIGINHHMVKTMHQL